MTKIEVGPVGPLPPPARPLRYRVRTVEIECVIDDPKKASYCVAGRRQEKGDRARVDLDLARHLAKVGKARVLPDSEKVEMR